MARASLAVQAEVAEELSRLARSKKMTLYSLTNYILENGVRLVREGVDFSSLRDLWSTHKLLAEVDAVILPSGFMDELLESLHRHEGGELFRRFRRLGHEIGQYARLLAADLKGLLELAACYMRFLPIKRMESRSLGEGVYEVMLTGVGGRMESTLCVYNIIEGVIEEYGARITERNVAKGIIWVKIAEGQPAHRPGRSRAL